MQNLHGHRSDSAAIMELHLITCELCLFLMPTSLCFDDTGGPFRLSMVIRHMKKLLELQADPCEWLKGELCSHFSDTWGQEKHLTVHCSAATVLCPECETSAQQTRTLQKGQGTSPHLSKHLQTVQVWNRPKPCKWRLEMWRCSPAVSHCIFTWEEAAKRWERAAFPTAWEHPCCAKTKRWIFWILLSPLLRGMFKSVPVKVACPVHFHRSKLWTFLHDLGCGCTLGSYRYFGLFSSQLRIHSWVG